MSIATNEAARAAMRGAVREDLEDAARGLMATMLGRAGGRERRDLHFDVAAAGRWPTAGVRWATDGVLRDATSVPSE